MNIPVCKTRSTSTATGHLYTASCPYAMRPTAPTYLLRPWQRFRTGVPPYGATKKGNNRWPLTTKDGNKNYYKGTGSSGIGRWVKHGRYKLNYDKVRTYVVPPQLQATELRPFVDVTAPPVSNSFKGYEKGAVDGKLYLQKLKEFVKYGASEVPGLERSKNFVERG